MKNFYLKSKKSGEVINSFLTDTKDSAIIYFSKMKRLKPLDLLSIYSVDDNK
jgi:hypothetical protein